MARLKVFSIALLLAGYGYSAFPLPNCFLQVLNAENLVNVSVPKGMQVYFVTPRLLIGRKESDEGEWLRVVAKDTRRVVGTIAIRIQGDAAQIPIYFDGFIRTRNGVAGRELFMNARLREGLGTEAKKAALDYVFDQAGVQKVYARILWWNKPSLRFHRKLGFQEVSQGEVPESFQIFKETPTDLLYFILKKEDWVLKGESENIP